MKKAFTLIEMLIVVGIIAVLMSIVLVNIRGATDSANATKCMNNMRNLFVAMDAIGMDSGSYPLAGPCIRKAAPKELVAIDLFDIYSSKELGKGRRSFAYKLAFRAADRTLTDDEVNPAFAKILDALRTQLKIEVRDS